MNKEAIMLLNPKTTASALAEIEYYNGFRGREACIEAIEDACRLAIEALEKQIPKSPIYTNEGTVTRCPNCEAIHFRCLPTVKIDYCVRCGQAIDWDYDVDTEHEAYQDEMGGMAEVVASEVE